MINKRGGYFILTDHFSLCDEEEIAHKAQLLRLKAEQEVADDVFCHYDTSLTVEHEQEALQRLALHMWKC